jgi:hypothetical protein
LKFSLIQQLLETLGNLHVVVDDDNSVPQNKENVSDITFLAKRSVATVRSYLAYLASSPSRKLCNFLFSFRVLRLSDGDVGSLDTSIPPTYPAAPVQAPQRSQALLIKQDVCDQSHNKTIQP